MKVNELAEELDIPTSAVLAQCQRFGIDAAWAGADLRRSDVVVLRAELATGEGDDPMAARGAGADGSADAPDSEQGSEPDGAPEGDRAPTDLPPASAGSIPGLFEDAEETPSTAQPARPVGGFTFAGAATPGVSPASGEVRSSAHEPRPPAPRLRHFDHGLRTAAIALVLSALLVVGSNLLFDSPWPLAGAWFVAAIALLFGTLRAVQARYRTGTHPDRIRGGAIATVLVGVGLVAIVVFGMAVWVITRTAPSKDAPLRLGHPAAVTNLRWGWGRLTLTAHNGWDPAAKDPSTCWEDRSGVGEGAKDLRRAERTELGQDLISCFRPHTYEVFDRWSVDHVRDSAYPGVDAFRALATTRCSKELDRLNQSVPAEGPVGATLGVEYPSADGWAQGDHDLTCVAQTSPRQTRLSD